MYSILVNPTHAVTGALAPSSPFCGFIFSFSCDLIFFSFSLFLTPLWLCIGDRLVYLIDFVSPLPRFPRFPWAHTSSLCALCLRPLPSLIYPCSPRSCSLHSVCSVLLVHPIGSLQPVSDFHLWNPFSSSCVGGPELLQQGGAAGEWGKEFSISYPPLAPTRSFCFEFLQKSKL